MQLPSEKFLEDVVCELINEGKANDVGLPINCSILHSFKVFRQVHLSAYGIADIIVVNWIDSVPSATILELKNVPLTSKDINQIFRYKRALELMEIFDSIDCILIGSSLSDCHYVFNECSENLELFTFNMDVFDGLQFENHPGTFYCDCDTSEAQLLLTTYDDEKIF